MTATKLAERLAELEAKAKADLGQGMAESISKQLTAEEKQVLVAEYVRSAYGEIPGWDFSHLAEDYSRVSAKIAGLKAAANGC